MTYAILRSSLQVHHEIRLPRPPGIDPGMHAVKSLRE